MDLELYEHTAVEAARKSADILRSRFGNVSRIGKKKHAEIVTEADTESEKMIISTLLAEFPDHAVLSEECGLIKGASDFQWIIDPLDGTINFAHRIPLFSISIALALRDAVVLGVVLDPIREELFSAVIGRGAQQNGEPIHVSATGAIADSLLVTGFPYNAREIFEPAMARYGRCLKASQSIRRFGTAALHLCYVASGSFEGFWEQDLKSWDSAAGALIVAEAGGRVTTFSNRPYAAGNGEILATNGHIHQQMLELLKLSAEDGMTGSG